MSKKTLLDMTQNILSALDGDEVNSISDTVESMQVAEIIRETYEELFNNVPKPSLNILTQLDSVSDPGRPNYLMIPENIDNIFWIKYDYKTEGNVDYQEISYLSPIEFLQYTNLRSGNLDTETVLDYSGVSFTIITNKNPQFYTTFDNKNLIFDSYDASLDTTLQNAKSAVWAVKATDFEMSDSFIPPIDAKLFPMLIAEAKSVAFINLKQTSSAKEEQRSKRQRVRGMNDLWRSDQRRPYNQVPNYGRRSRVR
jgi:hypothetical protein